MITTALGLLFGLALPAGFVFRAHRGLADRRAGLESLVECGIGLLLAWLWVAWDAVPRLVYAVPASLTAYGLLLLARAWPHLPWLAGPGRGWKVAGAVTTTVVAVVLAVAMA